MPLRQIEATVSEVESQRRLGVRGGVQHLALYVGRRDEDRPTWDHAGQRVGQRGQWVLRGRAGVPTPASRRSSVHEHGTQPTWSAADGRDERRDGGGLEKLSAVHDAAIVVRRGRG